MKRITVDDLELIRNWRNHPKISSYMEFRDHISAEMQNMWFSQINNNYNFYYIVEYFNKKIALANIKNVDYVKKTGEGGLFIWEDEFLNSLISYKISYALYDFAFNDLGLRKLFCHILRTNKRAIDFNKSLGFVKQKDQDDFENQLYSLTREHYFIKQRKYVKYIREL